MGTGTSAGSGRHHITGRHGDQTSYKEHIMVINHDLSLLIVCFYYQVVRRQRLKIAEAAGLQTRAV